MKSGIEKCQLASLEHRASKNRNLKKVFVGRMPPTACTVRYYCYRVVLYRSEERRVGEGGCCTGEIGGVGGRV